MQVEAKLRELGFELPNEMRTPPGFIAKWTQVRIIGSRAIIAGHGPRLIDGTFAGIVKANAPPFARLVSWFCDDTSICFLTCFVL